MPKEKYTLYNFVNKSVVKRIKRFRFHKQCFILAQTGNRTVKNLTQAPKKTVSENDSLYAKQLCSPKFYAVSSVSLSRSFSNLLFCIELVDRLLNEDLIKANYSTDHLFIFVGFKELKTFFCV